jgi:tellurite resistance protein TehA-like permease
VVFGFWLILLALLGCSLWLLARGPVAHRATILQAVLFVGASIYLVVYVAGEDDYRGNGISRWDAYDAHTVTVIAIAGSLAVGICALVAERRRALVRLAGLFGAGAALLFGMAYLANSLN